MDVRWLCSPVPGRPGGESPLQPVVLASRCEPPPPNVPARMWLASAVMRPGNYQETNSNEGRTSGWRSVGAAIEGFKAAESYFSDANRATQLQKATTHNESARTAPLDFREFSHGQSPTASIITNDRNEQE